MSTYTKEHDGTIRFKTKLVRDDKSSACAVHFPFDLKEIFGRVRVPVEVTLNGAPFRTTTFQMCGSQFFVVNEQMRRSTGLGGGDAVEVTMKPDTEERKIEVPEALAKMLKKHPAEKEYFDSLAFTHQKEFSRWIDSAKKDETRDRRLAKCIEMLKAKQKPSF